MTKTRDILDVLSEDRLKAHPKLDGGSYERSIMAYAWVASAIDVLERIRDTSTDETARNDASWALEARSITYD